jgi:thiamine biosynthesis lipoprotein ApbE
VQRALLELSGDYLALSAPEGMAGWPLAVADPWSGAPSEHVLDLRGEALATSSSRPGTILDPRTGEAVSRLLQVSVAAPTACLADQRSTALLVRELSWFDATQVARWA